jgi:hypothetical protein
MNSNQLIPLAFESVGTIRVKGKKEIKILNEELISVSV